jgi:hypothetical protein
MIDSLVNWLKHNKADAFGCNKFPFYSLHARQYLLISFARISVEHPELLHKYSHLFLDYGLCEHHILIQKFATDIVFKIENAFPETYEKDVLMSIKNVGKSKMPIQKEDYNYTTDKYWHKYGEVTTDVDFHFGWDFDRYWYKPLGDVFGIPGKQIQNIAATLIVKEWGCADKNAYNKDPRVALWNRSSDDHETWHDHFSYPRTDNLDFYLSYHAMLVVAARLIEKMPVIKKRDWHDDEWADWVSRHLLTRDDGKWLADSRNSLPINRPHWISEDNIDIWQNDIIEEDFLNCLNTKEQSELWINVKGSWHEKSNERKETFFVSSALVSTKTSDALLNALATCSDPFDYKLPHFDEADMEIESGIFQLKGWIIERSISKGLDEFDPYADGINYPPYSLGTTITDRCKLKIGNNGRTWQMINSSKNVLICEAWSSHREIRDEEPDQSGMRLKASLPFLKHLCETMGCSMIFDIGIQREISYKYNKDKREYTKPKHKIFILSEDGKLRTTHTSHQPG